MRDPLIVLGVAEAVLFLAIFGITSGSSQIGPTRRKAGLVLLGLWAVVPATCIIWGITRVSA